MQFPSIDGLRDPRDIGSGPSGTVFSATDANAQPVIVKVFLSTAINRKLLTQSIARLEASTWPAGVMPIQSANFQGRPSLHITAPYLTENKLPNNLQHRLAEHPAPQSLPLVRELAAALAQMHNRHVTHGNLKPGNIFFSESGELLLCDWCLGLMPDVPFVDYSDALLYAPPEQLLNPSSYHDHAGYRWDVFAFGVLSYRLLTGLFPRCHATFSHVAPAAGETKRDGIIADTAKIAESLASEPHVTWPHEPHTPREAQYHHLILRCLSLNPADRPATMAEVHREFAEIDHHFAAEEIRAVLQDQRRGATRQASTWKSIAAILIAVIALLGYFWSSTSTQLKQQNLQYQSTTASLQAKLDNTLAEAQITARTTADTLAAARQAQKNAELALASSRESDLAALQASRENADLLFSMIFEPLENQNPDSQNTSIRLAALEKHLLDLTSSYPPTAAPNEELARIKLQLAEISLSTNDLQKAPQRLQDAIAARQTLEKSPRLQVRLAANQLQLAMLQQIHGDKRTSDSYLLARQALDAIASTTTQRDHHLLLKAILNYREAQLLSASGLHAKALDQLRTATAQFHQLITARPDVTRLRSQLSECFLTSANVLEGMNDFGNAREVRTLAVTEINNLIKAHPRDISHQLKLCETYTAMAHASLIAGDTRAVDQLSENATTLLKKILLKHPQNRAAATTLAAQHHFRATLLEDSGDAAQALANADSGLKLLEFAEPATATADPLPHYYRALLLWQKGRLLGSNSRTQELALEKQALAILDPLKNTIQHPQIRSEHVLMNLAQLLSDMAHASHINRQRDAAKEYFLAAAKQWQNLSAIHPDNPEYRNAAQWCQDRLKDL